MIARIWKGAVRRDVADDYTGSLRATGVADYAAAPGNRGTWMLRRDADDRTEVVMVTLWDSIEAVMAFAGEDYEQAVFLPEDERFLIQRDLCVAHYEVAAWLDGRYAWTPTKSERTRVLEFLAVYGAAFEALHASAIADLFAYPLQVATDAARVDVATVPTREAWLPQIERLVAAYRAIGVRAAHIDELDILRPTPNIRLATVRWRLSDAGGEEIYTFDASYSLVDRGDGLRITAIFHDETPRLVERMKRLGEPTR